VQDTIYFEAQFNKTDAEDVLQYYDQASANRTTTIEEVQKPNLFAGYHHEWSPGNHTLFLVGMLSDVYDAGYYGPGLEINRRPAGAIYDTHLRPFGTELHNSIEGYTVELQQILTFGKQTVVFGGRYQNADSDARDVMSAQSGSFPGSFVYPASFHVSDGTIERASGYLYDMWQIVEQLHLTAGLTYDYLSYPVNQEVAPLSSGATDTSLLTPKVGLSYTPFRDTLVRGAYTRSLGGVFFDNSFRLEPTQIEGFNQAFRSLIPESVVGNLPGTEFETIGFGLDQKFGTGTYITLLGEQLESQSKRTIGTYDRYQGQIVAQASSTPVRLNFQERTFAAALSQLIGDYYTVGVRYRFTDAELQSQLPEIPATLPASSQKQEATLQQVQMYAGLNLPCGFFSQVQAIWSQQDNQTPALAGDSFWQFNLFAGYRFWRHHAEAQIGLLNLTDQDYQLNPLTLYTELPRERTFYASFKFYF
jgi:outer membrane receptor protein involved in Fe transport